MKQHKDMTNAFKWLISETPKSTLRFTYSFNCLAEILQYWILSKISEHDSKQLTKSMGMLCPFR